MGLKQNILIKINGKDLTVEPSSITYKDEAGTKSDSLTLEFAGEYLVPKYKDKISVVVDDFPFGMFVVQNTKLTKYTTTVEATATDFNGTLKQKQNTSHSTTTTKVIAQKIAKKHNLKCKCDVENNITHISQINQSDLLFLSNLAKIHNANFSIKNETLLFLKNNKKTFSKTIDANECEDYELDISNKDDYKSCTAKYHDTKQNKVITITAGSGEPSYSIKREFKNKTEAKQQVEAMLNNKGKNKITGNLSIYGMPLEVGTKIELKGHVLTINTIEHTINESGWNMQIELES